MHERVSHLVEKSKGHISRDELNKLLPLFGRDLLEAWVAGERAGGFVNSSLILLGFGESRLCENRLLAQQQEPYYQKEKILPTHLRPQTCAASLALRAALRDARRVVLRHF